MRASDDAFTLRSLGRSRFFFRAAGIADARHNHLEVAADRRQPAHGDAAVILLDNRVCRRLHADDVDSKHVGERRRDGLALRVLRLRAEFAWHLEDRLRNTHSFRRALPWHDSARRRSRYRQRAFGAAHNEPAAAIRAGCRRRLTVVVIEAPASAAKRASSRCFSRV